MSFLRLFAPLSRPSSLTSSAPRFLANRTIFGCQKIVGTCAPGVNVRLNRARRLWAAAAGSVALTALAVSGSFAFGHGRLYLDAPPDVSLVRVLSDAREQELASEDVAVDPATTISFPTSLTVPAKVKIPPLTLVGLGVRTVSFLGIKVYSVGFYADLNDPTLKIPKDMPPEEKIKHLVRNTACVVRIVPTRSTSYTHLRDAFMRALQSRMTKAKAEGALTEEQAQAIASPMRKLKSIFPNSSLSKHAAFDVFLTAPMLSKQRTLVFRDLGAIESDWVATELVLHYFEGNAPSPALKKSVLEKLETFEKP